MCQILSAFHVLYGSSCQPHSFWPQISRVPKGCFSHTACRQARPSHARGSGCFVRSAPSSNSQDLPCVSFTALTCLTIHWIISTNKHAYCDFFYLIRYNKINIFNQVSPASNHPILKKPLCSTSPRKWWCPCLRSPPSPAPTASCLFSAHSEGSSLPDPT